MSRYVKVGDTVLHRATGQTGVVADTTRIYGSPNVYITAVVDGALHTFNSEDLCLVPPMDSASTVEPMKPDARPMEMDRGYVEAAIKALKAAIEAERAGEMARLWGELAKDRAELARLRAALQAEREKN